MNEDDRYLIQDSRTYVGNSVIWWRHEGKGYTTDFDDAGIFTKERALAQQRSRPTDIAWKYSDITSLMPTRQVDMQGLQRLKKTKTPRKSPSDRETR